MAKKKITKPRQKTTKKKKSAPVKPKTKIAKPTRQALKKKTAPKRKVPRSRSRIIDADAQISPVPKRGMGALSGGQSGDTQGISGIEDAGSESVEELLEEGQTFEAEAVQGVEDAPDADQGEVHTRQVPEDDVPEEYRDASGVDTDR